MPFYLEHFPVRLLPALLHLISHQDHQYLRAAKCYGGHSISDRGRNLHLKCFLHLLTFWVFLLVLLY